MILVIVIMEWVYYARVTANLVKSAKEEAYVISAQTMGLSLDSYPQKLIYPALLYTSLF